MKIALVGGAALGLLAAASLYTIDAREVAVVTSFGAPVRTVLDPGLYVRAPWPLHDVVRFDRRSRLLDIEATEVLSRDKKNLVVEAFVVWRVAKPQLFLEAVGGDTAAESRLTDVVVSQIAAGLGNKDFAELLAVREDAAVEPLLPSSVTEQVAAGALERFGIEVLDLRLRHLGLPLQNEQSIYERMRAERARIANAYRSEGEEQATAIRAKADREAAELLAAAERDAGAISNTAEAAAARLQGQAYSADPEFYGFVRSLESYPRLIDDDAVLVLDADTPLLRELGRVPE